MSEDPDHSDDDEDEPGLLNGISLMLFIFALCLVLLVLKVSWGWQ